MIYMGIDPGKGGGVAWQVVGGNGAVAEPMPPTVVGIRELFRDIVSSATTLSGEVGGALVAMEKVGGYIAGNKQPGSAMFNFGHNAGVLEMACACYDLPTELIAPQRWQKMLGLGTRGSRSRAAWKRKLKARAEQLYPSVKVTLKTADALLLLEVARRLRKGGE